MTRSADQLRKYRARFAWAFAISLVLTALSLRLSLPGKASPHPGAATSPDITTILPFVTLATSLTSLIGLVLTTTLAFRRERRERQAAELDLEKKRLEVEKLRAELTGKSRND